MTQSSAFNIFHTGVQKWIIQQRWQVLRSIQEDAAPHILNADRDVIISAPTASGKTEAAFLPACSYIKKKDKSGVRILYISLLKALINDQYRRLIGLCEDMHIHLTPWHGDVSQSLKKKQKQKSSGIILITPESLESRFLKDFSWCKTAFADLDYLIIDEFHTFLGTQRGCQLLSLMERIDFLACKNVPRIALSATLSNMEQVKDYLRPTSDFPCELVLGDIHGSTGLKLLVKGYREPSMPDNLDKIGSDLYRILRKKSHLIFANARATVEYLSDQLRQHCIDNFVENEFFPHHGNISKNIREELEKRLQKNTIPTTAIATSTLELGIDIAAVDSVVQISVPPTVASIRQRLGRSGRISGEDAVLRVMTMERDSEHTHYLQDRLRVNTVQSIAMINLLLGKWCEPPPKQQYHFSTLVQQTLSVISSYGSVRAHQLWHLLCKNGPFHLVDEQLYANFLRHLASNDFIQQMHDGSIVIGAAGEKLANNYLFCLAFKTDEEYTLKFQGRSIGTIPMNNPVCVGQTIIFTGTRWIVLRCDEDKKIIELKKSTAGKVPRFNSDGFMVHGKIREEMFQIYNAPKEINYLDGIAQDFLQEGIACFHSLGLGSKKIIQEGDSVYILPWCDDRILETIKTLLLFKKGALKSVSCYYGIIEINDTSTATIIQMFRTILTEPKPSHRQLCSGVHSYMDKLDWTLSADLRDLGYSAKMFDLDGAWNIMNELIARHL